MVDYEQGFMGQYRSLAVTCRPRLRGSHAQRGSAGPDVVDDRSGSVAVVTGAASGIGLSTCELLLEERAAVVGLDLGKVPPRVAAHPGFTSLSTDVTNVVEVTAAADEVRDRLRRCDVLVNCAGVLVNGSVTETSEETWDRVMAVNLRGAWLVCRAFVPLMASSGGGAIVSVASGTGVRPRPRLAAYSASKAGLISLARSMALDYGDVGIRSNCVCPGPTATPMLLEDAENIKTLEESGGAWPVPLARPDEIARAILLLSSPLMPRLTGVALAIDGGRSLH